MEARIRRTKVSILPLLLLASVFDVVLADKPNAEHKLYRSLRQQVSTPNQGGNNVVARQVVGQPSTTIIGPTFTVNNANPAVVPAPVAVSPTDVFITPENFKCGCIERGNPCTGYEDYVAKVPVVYRKTCQSDMKMCCCRDEWPAIVDTFANILPCVPVNTCGRYYGQLPTDVAEYGIIGPCISFGHVRCLQSGEGVAVQVVSDTQIHSNSHSTTELETQPLPVAPVVPVVSSDANSAANANTEAGSVPVPAPTIVYNYYPAPAPVPPVYPVPPPAPCTSTVHPCPPAVVPTPVIAPIPYIWKRFNIWNWLPSINFRKEFSFSPAGFKTAL